MVEAAADQAVDIIRRRGDRADGAAKMPRISDWIPHILYSHLVLQDYMAQRLPEPVVVCPEDAHRRNWQDWRRFDAGEFGNMQPTPTPHNSRWPYSSSYQTVPATFAPDAVRMGRGTLIQGGDMNSYLIAGPRTQDMLGGRRLSEVAFPSQKVQMHDEAARHNGAARIFADPDAVQPILHFDQSVRLRKTAHANRGFKPEAPRSVLFTTFTYFAQPWEAPSRHATLIGHYRWTRGGLQGVDFGGGEVDTSMWR